MVDYRDKAVLVTGGTKGIGLAIGLAFGRQGARTFLTHRWGSADEGDIKSRFEQAGAPDPTIVEADVSNEEDTRKVLGKVRADHDHLEVFVSNVAVVQPALGIESYRRRSLKKSLEYSAWPLVAYLQEADDLFEALPSYVIGISSDGADSYFSRYEYVAASKAVMETMCRYLSRYLRKRDIRINIIRTRNVVTDAVGEIFGPKYLDFMRKYAGEENFIWPEEVANVALALCSGMLDAMNGQVIQVDKGAAFADTLMRTMESLEESGDL